MQNKEDNAHENHAFDYLKKVLVNYELLIEINENSKKTIEFQNKEIAKLQKLQPAIKLVPAAPVYNFNIN